MCQITRTTHSNVFAIKVSLENTAKKVKVLCKPDRKNHLIKLGPTGVLCHCNFLFLYIHRFIDPLRYNSRIHSTFLIKSIFRGAS